MYSLRLNKNCFGQGFDSPHLHQSILEFMVLEYTLGGCTGFDRAISSEVENTVCPRYRSKTIIANDDYYFEDLRLAA